MQGYKNGSITGVLLVNLGTPDKPDSSSIRRFLREFLSDKRVVEVPRAVWLIVLNLFILPFRPAKLVKAYQSIWTDEGAPLLTIAYKQQLKLDRQIREDEDSRLTLATGMRYGNPSIASALNELKSRKIDNLLVLPLYAQYSGSTTAAIFDEVSRVLQGWRNIPELRIIKDYYNHPAYIQALANSVNNARKNYAGNDNAQNTSRHLLISFHGIPLDYCKKGDPYDVQCRQTAELLANKLGLNEKQWTMTFQSRFGKAEWLQPYTMSTLEKMPGQGIDCLDVICPGFSNDCLETLEEIDVENREVFMQAGGKDYQYIPALNDSDDHIRLMLELIKTHTHGWQ